MQEQFHKGQKVMILAHPETHDFGEVAATVIDGHDQAETGYVSVQRIGVVIYSVPVQALRAVALATPPDHGQLRRGILGAGLLALAALGLVLSAKAAKADASPLAFWQLPQAPATPTRRGRKAAELVETGRFVSMPLPLPRPAYIRGRFTCALNVNRHLAARGIEGTGTAWALDFASWGRASHQRPGAVQVERRRGGGHVKIVSHHDGERWICLNPSASRQKWQLAPCGGRAIAWRVA